MGGEVDAEALWRMVDLVDPALTVTAATPATRGFCRVYRLPVEESGTIRECFLKAAPEDTEAGIGADARVLAVLDRHTSILVPEVLGAVDDHPERPSPFYLMTPMPGDELSYERVGWLPADSLETPAREVGAHLGELHGVDAVDSFGYVDRDPTRSLDGGRPSGTVADLAVRGGADSWPTCLGGYVERELERHADSRFKSLTPRLEAWCGGRLDGLDGPFSPVLGRNDHGLHNLLVEPQQGRVTAMFTRSPSTRRSTSRSRRTSTVGRSSRRFPTSGTAQSSSASRCVRATGRPLPVRWARRSRPTRSTNAWRRSG